MTGRKVYLTRRRSPRLSVGLEAERNLFAGLEKGLAACGASRSPQERDNMPEFVLIVDLFGVILAVIGFIMAFRQKVARRMLGRPAPRSAGIGDDSDPLTYILRIAGVMVMVFGLALGLMVTLFHLA